MAQNTTKNFEKENEKLKASLDIMIQKSEKSEKRDNKIFEKIMGKQPKNSDMKIRDMISGYENQKERLEQRIILLEKQMQKVNDVNVRLINENKSLSKGSAQANSQYFYMKDEGKLLNRIEELEKIKDNLMKALARKEETIESNLEEIETIKEVKEQMNNRIRALEHDLRSCPSVNDLHVLNNKIAKLEKDNSQFIRDNNNLENENMLLKNDLNGHIKNKDMNKAASSLEPKTENNLEYDNSTSFTILKKILEILNIQHPLNQNYVSDEASYTILETVMKIQRVVMAVPRMEAFIKQVCSAVFPHTQNPQLESIIPEIHRLHHVVYSMRE